MIQKSHNRLGLLNKYVSEWVKRPHYSRALIGELVVQSFYELGMAEELDGIINFKKTKDFSHDMRVRSQKFFRWLGHYEDAKSQPGNLFYTETAVLNAMPEDLALSYLAEVYGPIGVFIGAKQDREAITNGNIAAALTKENMEAQLSVIELGDNPSATLIHNAHRELKESAGTTLAAIEALEGKYPKLVAHQKEKSRQPCFARTGATALQRINLVDNSQGAV